MTKPAKLVRDYDSADESEVSCHISATNMRMHAVQRTALFGILELENIEVAKLALVAMQVYRMAECAAVNAEQILQYASHAAVRAQMHVEEPEDSDSGLDEKTPVRTVTRVLRAYTGPKAKGSKQPMSTLGETSYGPEGAANDCRTNKDCSASGKQAAAHGSGEGKLVGDEPVLSEEERRARKRAKKMRQKLKHAADGAHAEVVSKAKAKRERKKARLRALNQAAVLT
jgi:hypothetical protein